MHTDYAQSLFEAIPESAILLDKTGRVVDWNQNATALFGYHKKEVLGKSINLIYQQNHPFPKIIQDILPQQKNGRQKRAMYVKMASKGSAKLLSV